jgi:hypothetical protein
VKAAVSMHSPAGLAAGIVIKTQYKQQLEYYRGIGLADNNSSDN